jgi:hypothetical protein
MINGSPGDTFENSTCKYEKRKYVYSNIKHIYQIHIMQLRCIKCAFLYHDTHEIITSFKFDVLKMNNTVTPTYYMQPNI